jgi:hypothetical protein
MILCTCNKLTRPDLCLVFNQNSYKAVTWRRAIFWPSKAALGLKLAGYRPS